ncbi:MAG: TetR/AcrR family transcriptional regulator [Aestuariivirga sp.]|jgi:AcrR family transcriptional regulator|uniref:TetR/AcrR family transcriptional regulator n=1 Tax=Aestuariivirga sp. TaxID=2650926 RepID=UPI0038D243FF
MLKKTREPMPRDAGQTRKRILDAATAEFARKGLGGARVDAIAARAKSNKRMIYHYFGSKEGLFTAVLENAYLGIRSAEQRLRLEELEPEEAIARLVRFTWNYYLAHPEFLTLVNSENLHRAKHLKTSEAIRQSSGQLVAMVGRILERGVKAGVFRPGVDPVQLNITIAAIGYYYFTNRFTGAIVYERDYMAPANLDARLAFNLDTILRLLKKD